MSHGLYRQSRNTKIAINPKRFFYAIVLNSANVFVF